MGAIRELIEYRQMIYSMVRKEIRGRYKGSVLGFMWTFLNPLLQLVVYTLVFSVIMRAEIEKYYLFLFVALVPWMFFSGAVTSGAESVVESADLIKKIYFPREVLTIAKVTSAFVNMILTFVAVFFVLIVTGYGINPAALLFMPIVMAVEYIFCLGIAMIVSSLTVYFRDLLYILNIVVMAWQYLTPVMYPESWVPEQLMFLWRLNPMTPVINAYRDILYYKKTPELANLALACTIGVVFILVGYLIFRRLQKGFVEEL